MIKSQKKMIKIKNYKINQRISMNKTKLTKISILNYMNLNYL